MSEAEIKVISINRQAYHDFFIEETFEVGIALLGTEIKSIRAGKVNLRGAYAHIIRDEVWLENSHIAIYEEGSDSNHDPLRRRKLLLHHRQISYLIGKIQTKGLTLVPLKIYLKGNIAKLELGLCRGKKQYDKRSTITERMIERELARVNKFRTR